MAEKLTRDEAIQYLTKQRDLAADALRDGDANGIMAILLETGEAIGYTPAFRCLVKGLEPEESIRWGK